MVFSRIIAGVLLYFYKYSKRKMNLQEVTGMLVIGTLCVALFLFFFLKALQGMIDKDREKANAYIVLATLVGTVLGFVTFIFMLE